MTSFLKFLPFSHFKVYGNSMYPTLKEGEHLFTQNWFLTLKEKDLVVALVDKRLVIKRIKQIKDKKLFLEGDNSSHSTSYQIFKDQIIGKVCLVLNS